MLKKVLCLQHSEANIGGRFDFVVNDDNVTVEITSSKFEQNQCNQVFLSISFAFQRKIQSRFDQMIRRTKPCYKIEILNAKDETVFSYLDMDNNNNNVDLWKIQNFCNLSVLQKPTGNNLISQTGLDSSRLSPHIKMVLTFGRKDEIHPLSTLPKLSSTVQMVRSILNETAFDDPQFEAESLLVVSVNRLRIIINAQNAAKILHLAQKYDLDSLKEDAVKFFAGNFSDVMETRDWKEMPDRLRNELLSTVLLSLKLKS